MHQRSSPFYRSGSSKRKCCLFFLHSSFSSSPQIVMPFLSVFIPVFITVCLHSGVHTLPSPSFIPHSLSHTFMACFCSVSGLWCFSNAHKITLTFPLSVFTLSQTHMCTLTPPSSQKASIRPSPPLTSLASLWSHQSPMPLQSAFILTQKEKRGMYLCPAGAQSSLLLCEMIHLWLTALLETYSKQTTVGCGIFHPNRL